MSTVNNVMWVQVMSKAKRSPAGEQAKQLRQLLKDYGMSGKNLPLSEEERKKLEDLFPE